MFNGGAVVYTYTDPTRPGRRQTLPETIHPAILLWRTERCRSLLRTRAADYMGAVAPRQKNYKTPTFLSHQGLLLEGK